jgi:hypothetical protein
LAEGDVLMRALPPFMRGLNASSEEVFYEWVHEQAHDPLRRANRSIPGWDSLAQILREGLARAESSSGLVDRVAESAEIDPAEEE